MSKLTLLITVLAICALNAFCQDKFPVTRLTYDPAQEGFATWSLDGKSIVYSRICDNDTLRKTGLWKITPDGKNAVQILSELAEHPKWSPDGKYIVFDADSGNSMKMIPAEGGSPISFLPDSIHLKNGGLPCWSPDGQRIAFHEGTTTTLCVANIKTRDVTKIFHEEGMLPLPACWSRDGKSILISLIDRKNRKSTMWKVASDGSSKQQITGHHEGFHRHMALSPDGSLLVYAAKEGKDLSLWIMPAEGGKSIPLTVTHPGHNEGANWSPDGKRIAFTSTRGQNFDIWMMDVDIEQIKKELKAINE